MSITSQQTLLLYGTVSTGAMNCSNWSSCTRQHATSTTQRLWEASDGERNPVWGSEHLGGGGLGGGGLT